MHVSTEGFRAIVTRLRAAAEAFAGGRVVLLTEGGYHLEAFRDSLQATVDVFSSQPDRQAAAATPDAGPVGAMALATVRAAQARYWPTL
jgi:acetoin utilization deacetylase AcuC-like enzyme